MEHQPPQPKIQSTTVALFPQDWMRDPDATNRHAEHIDLPQDDDRLLAARELSFVHVGSKSLLQVTPPKQAYVPKNRRPERVS